LKYNIIGLNHFKRVAITALLLSIENNNQINMKTWFITGSSSGLGRILTEKLLQKGDRVAATCRKSGALDELKVKYGELLWLAQLDVTLTENIKEVVNRAFTDLGTIDVIVNNAGYALFCAAEEASDQQIIDQINTNILGSMQVIRATLPYLRKQGSGRILQLSSAGGQVAYPNFSFYHATKWAIEGFSESVAQEVAPFNIGLTIVEPGATKTSFVSAMVDAPIMEAYDKTPAGDVRRAVTANLFPIPGDAEKTVQAMIDSTETHPAPLRLALGADAYTQIRDILTSRIESLDAQKDVALSTGHDQ
jgi:NADP-dependent 3-hydroxy acid dehydrogenase YdfG